jgi:hypothetical protein
VQDRPFMGVLRRGSNLDPPGRSKTDRVLPSLRKAEIRSVFHEVVKGVGLLDSVELARLEPA